jgi:hypothetical protein
MTDIREQRAKEIQEAIREVLYRDWDPIGVCDAGPDDEYDSYIGPVYRLLVSQPKKEEVTAELRRIEDGPIGIGASEDALTMAAEKLLALDLRLER